MFRTRSGVYGYALRRVLRGLLLVPRALATLSGLAVGHLPGDLDEDVPRLPSRDRVAIDPWWSGIDRSTWSWRARVRILVGVRPVGSLTSTDAGVTWQPDPRWARDDLRPIDLALPGTTARFRPLPIDRAQVSVPLRAGGRNVWLSGRWDALMVVSTTGPRRARR